MNLGTIGFCIFSHESITPHIYCVPSLLPVTLELLSQGSNHRKLRPAKLSNKSRTSVARSLTGASDLIGFGSDIFRRCIREDLLWDHRGNTPLLIHARSSNGNFSLPGVRLFNEQPSPSNLLRTSQICLHNNPFIDPKLELINYYKYWGSS